MDSNVSQASERVKWDAEQHQLQLKAAEWCEQQIQLERHKAAEAVTAATQASRKWCVLALFRHLVPLGTHFQFVATLMTSNLSAWWLIVRVERPPQAGCLCSFAAAACRQSKTEEYHCRLSEAQQLQVKASDDLQQVNALRSAFCTIYSDW